MKTHRHTIILVSIIILLAACAPLPTPASQPNSPSQSNAPSSNNSSGSSTDWQQFLTVEPWVGCVERVSPIAIDPNGNTEEQIASTNPIADVRINWAIVPFNSGSLFFYLTSIAENDWIQISKSLDVSVSTNSSIPDHVDVIAMMGCGGSQQIRDFPATNLRSDLRSFTQKSTFSSADFFTLQPGEFEVFNVPFECDAPGYYNISVTSEYSYQGGDGVIEFPEFDAMCPQSFTVYSVDGGGSLMGAQNYTWKNGEYSQSP